MRSANPLPFQRWRLYRLSVIAQLDDIPEVRSAMRCAASDCGQYPVNERQLPLGIPPCKNMLSFEVRMPQQRAASLLAALERALSTIPIVLLRLEAMGNHAEAARAACVEWVPGLTSESESESESAAAAAPLPAAIARGARR